MVKTAAKYHPQEIEVWYVLPAIRRELARVLIEREVPQRRIAKILGVTEASVSHYVKNKRGRMIGLSESARDDIKKAADRILKDQYILIDEMQSVCKKIRKNKELCRIHQRFEKTHNGCKICFSKS